MTTRISIWLFLVIATLIVLDQIMGWGASLYVIRKLFALIETLTFWR
jgi:hypothetical protein